MTWQLVFLTIARDARRYRPLMIPAILEKLLFGIPVLLLFANGRVGRDALVFRNYRPHSRHMFVFAFRTTKPAAS